MKKSRFLFLLTMVILLGYCFLFIYPKSKNKTNIENQSEQILINTDNIYTQENEIEYDVSQNVISLEEVKIKIDQNEGEFALFIKDLSNNSIYSIYAENSFHPLSLYKLPLTYSVVRAIQENKISWDLNIEYTDEDYFDGIGLVGSLPFESEFTVEEITEILLEESDNTSQKILKRVIGDEYLQSSFEIISENSKDEIDDWYSNPVEISSIIQNIFYNNYVSIENKEKLLSFMNPTSYDIFLSPYLDENYIFYHKVGIDEGTFHDCGILKKPNKDIIVCLMSDFTDKDTFDKTCRVVAQFLNAL